MNYFEIHKNKRPKALSKKGKYKDPTKLLITLSTAMSATQISIIKSQLGFDKLNKSISIAQVALSSSISIIKIAKNQKQLRFKATGRYIK